MKCLSLWQPHATLVVIAEKQFETRHWYTKFRGQLLIHAAKRWTGGAWEMCLDDPFSAALYSAGIRAQTDLPFGSIVGVADLTCCYLIGPTWMKSPGGNVRFAPASGTRERAFGDYYPGRYAWEMKNPRRFPTPIPFTGRQGIFNVPDELVAEQMAQAVAP